MSQPETLARSLPTQLVSGLRGWIPFSKKPCSERERVTLEPIRRGPYEVSLCRDPAELDACYRLRYEVLCAEFGRMPNRPGALDHDVYDNWADLLVLHDREAGKIVGMYRLLQVEHAPRVYSGDEFEVQPVLALPGRKVELSRACILPAYRIGSAITLLWRGIYAYMNAVFADVLFGCCSVQDRGLEQIVSVMRFLGQTEQLWQAASIRPIGRFDVAHQLLEAAVKHPHDIATRRDIPPLMRAYLKAGAKFVQVPAFDAAYQCYDFLTVLERSQLNPQMVVKFG